MKVIYWHILLFWRTMFILKCIYIKNAFRQVDRRGEAEGKRVPAQGHPQPERFGSCGSAHPAGARTWWAWEGTVAGRGVSFYRFLLLLYLVYFLLSLPLSLVAKLVWQLCLAVSWVYLFYCLFTYALQYYVHIYLPWLVRSPFVGVWYSTHFFFSFSILSVPVFSCTS